VAETNFVDVHPQKAQLKLWINLPIGTLNDERNIARNVADIGHWGNGDYEAGLKPGDDLDYLMILIKQSYTKSSAR
jgi:predicted transport protein